MEIGTPPLVAKALPSARGTPIVDRMFSCRLGAVAPRLARVPTYTMSTTR